MAFELVQYILVRTTSKEGEKDSLTYYCYRETTPQKGLKKGASGFELKYWPMGGFGEIGGFMFHYLPS